MKRNLLMAAMAKAEVSTAELAKFLDLSMPTLRRRLNGQLEFTCSEIRGIATICELSDQDILSIFFGERVS